MKIGIYKDTGVGGAPLGGTEYSAAVLAEELSKRHEVELVHHRERIDKDEFRKLFGTDLGAVQFRYVAKQADPFGRSRLPWRRYQQARSWHAEVSRPYEFFLAFIHLIPPYCHAPQGMFTILFPFIDRANTWPWKQQEGVRTGSLVKPWVRRNYFEWEWHKRLNSYAVKTVNSHFTAHWTLKRYGVPCEVHYPPSQSNFAPGEKTDTILSVGRFSPYKNQLEMIGAFRQLSEVHAKGWRYATVGAVEETHREGKLYYDAVCSLAAGQPIEALGNVELPKLRTMYQTAKIFWHAAGYPYDDERLPHVMEHFGIVTVEAMAAGCVPIVINKGGQPEIVEHGVNGFLWNTLEELKGYTALLAADENLRKRMAAAARERAQRFSTEMYIKRFYELVPSLAP